MTKVRDSAPVPTAPSRTALPDPGTGALTLAFQPILDLRTRRPVGAEALLRWSVDGAELAPPTFWHLVDLPLARSIGRFVLDAACRQLAEWRAVGGCPQLSVNVDPREINPRWVGDVRAALSRHQLPADALTLELTETARIEAATGRECAATLVDSGIGVALDDAGTGYNALASIGQIPLTELKIDRGFVAQIGDARSEAVIRALVGVARDLGLRTVAEGVETAAQAEWLESEGIDCAQGFLFSPPLTARAFALYWRSAHRLTETANGAAFIRRLNQRGASPATIAAILNRRAVPGPKGRRWRAQSVARALATPPSAKAPTAGLAGAATNRPAG